MLKRIEIAGFKSFGKKAILLFDTPITGVVGPNGSGKSNVAEALRFVLGEQSLKSLRGKRGEDLIFSGAGKDGRLGKASVKIAFDNSDKRLWPEWDEVVIEREVHRDGTNEYLVNGSKVRLRDIIEMLSRISLGPSGHHIISQGQADRVLSASVKERREMLEDALGLKIYKYKLSESEKKLVETRENIDKTNSLRREIAPHLRFLKKQAEEAERAVAIAEELKAVSLEYFRIEKDLLHREKQSLDEGRLKWKQELDLAQEELKKISERLK